MAETAGAAAPSFARDMAVSAAEENGAYDAVISNRWDVWTPNGGYLAGLTFLAMTGEARLRRPASFQCNFLRPAMHGPARITVEKVRQSRTTEVLRAALRQGDKAVLAATAVFVGEGMAGHETRFGAAPDAPAIETLKSVDDLVEDRDSQPRYWGNIDMKPAHFRETPDPLDPVFLAWVRLKGAAGPLTPELAAARLLIWSDLAPYSALSTNMHWASPWIAPNLDLYVQFHALAEDRPWLLVEGVVPVAGAGLVGANTRIFSPEGDLLVSSASQLICQPNPLFEHQKAWTEAYMARRAAAAAEASHAD